MTSSWVPPWANPFLDREQVMKDMAAWVETCRDQGITTRMYAHGLEGLGVSSLVAQFAKIYRDLISGPLIWLRGRGPDGDPIPVGELLTHVLRWLEVSDSDQSVPDGQKVQLLALTPHDAPGVVVIATSSFEQRDLAGDHGFEPFTPELLTHESSILLFRHGLRQTAAELDSRTIDDLVALCGGLPLPIKLLAAQLRGRAALAGPLLTRLRNSELSLLDIGTERRIARFLEATYTSIEPALRTAYRRLGVLPATDFCLSAATAALDTDPDHTAWVLAQLTELHLLTETSHGRYAFHPVLRDDARIRAEATDEPDVRRDVIRRWVDWCLRTAIPRGRALSSRWWVAPVTARSVQYYGADLPEFSRDVSLAWFDVERPNLVAAVRAAHRNGFHDDAWQLCVVMWKYLHLHGFHDAWIRTHEAGLESARAAGSDIGAMQLSQQLGAAYLATERLDEAEATFDQFLTAARRIGHVIGEQSALEWLGKTAARAGHYARAEHFYQRSWDVTAAATEAGINPEDKARIFALLRLQRNRARAEAGQWDRMVDDIEPAIAYFDQHPNETDNRAKTRLVRGRALLARGEAAQAETEFRTVAELFKEEQAHRGRADAEFWRAKAFIDAQRREEALICLDLAFTLFRELGDSRAAQVAELREHLGG
ncbi:tetratricopeptide repeat protein [Nocardia cyriacigeorgica]|uniref:tetratricopeptide repeat protein n=1 Tax=Nocardia cyriacigeorgica TaxID=135487 RepID=UPI0024549691|nr:tetratricopeptide repeat protein [Nocardia cyriacigeorgica]